MKIKPFKKRIYIKPDVQKTLIQSNTQKKIEIGTILAVGEDCKLKVGDRIIFTTWGVDVVEVNGERLFFILESDEFILARI